MVLLLLLPTRLAHRHTPSVALDKCRGGTYNNTLFVLPAISCRQKWCVCVCVCFDFCENIRKTGLA